MVSPQNGTPTLSRPRAYLFTGAVLLGLAAFGALFVTVDQFYYGFASARFPSVGDSPWLATLWGIVSRAHLVVLAAPFVIRWPRLLGFQVGKTAQYGRMLLVMLLANCGVIAAYLWLTGATTPYSGDQWLVTEAIIVPVVEETIWRGLVLTILLGLLRAVHSENPSGKCPRRCASSVRRYPGPQRGRLGGRVRLRARKDREPLAVDGLARRHEHRRGPLLTAIGWHSKVEGV